jgi:hypothetical protein
MHICFTGSHAMRGVGLHFAVHYNRGRPHTALGLGFPEPSQTTIPANRHRLTCRAVIKWRRHPCLTVYIMSIDWKRRGVTRAHEGLSGIFLDNNRVIEFVITDVAYDPGRPEAASLAPAARRRTRGKGEHVHSVAVAVVAHGAIPYGAGGRQAGIRIIGLLMPITLTENDRFWQTAQTWRPVAEAWFHVRASCYLSSRTTEKVTAKLWIYRLNNAPVQDHHTE